MSEPPDTSCDDLPASWSWQQVEKLALPGKNSLATGPFGSAIGAKHFVDEGVPVIRGGNLSTDVGARLIDHGLVFLSSQKAGEFSRSTVRAGDLVFTCWGTINQVGLIDGRARFEKYVVSNKQMKLSVDPDKANSLFLYYLFSSPEIQQQILSNGIGAAVPGFNLGQLRSMNLLVPPKVEQDGIARLLGGLDDKIDLLGRQNRTLEGMVGAVFRHWFLDEVDDHWAERSVSDFAEHIKQGVQPADQPSIPFHHYSLPAFDRGQRPVVELGSQILSNKFKVPEGTLLVSKLNPRVSRIWPVDKLPEGADAVCSTEFQVLKPKNPAWFGYLYGLLTSDDARDALTMAASGTSGSHQRVRPEDILAIKTSLPGIEAAEKYSSWVEPILSKRLRNIEQIAALENLRDALLPKLMSGELRVAD